MSGYHRYDISQGWSGGGWLFLIQPPHPQNLSHIYDTLTFMFECQGGVVGGGYFSFNPPPPPYPQNLSHIYDTLTFMFECQGWGGWGSIKNGKQSLQIQN